MTASPSAPTLDIKAIRAVMSPRPKDTFRGTFGHPGIDALDESPLLFGPGVYAVTGPAQSGKTTFAIDVARHNAAAGVLFCRPDVLGPTGSPDDLPVPSIKIDGFADIAVAVAHQMIYGAGQPSVLVIDNLAALSQGNGGRYTSEAKKMEALCIGHLDYLLEYESRNISSEHWEMLRRAKPMAVLYTVRSDLRTGELPNSIKVGPGEQGELSKVSSLIINMGRDHAPVSVSKQRGWERDVISLRPETSDSTDAPPSLQQKYELLEGLLGTLEEIPPGRTFNRSSSLYTIRAERSWFLCSDEDVRTFSGRGLSFREALVDLWNKLTGQPETIVSSTDDMVTYNNYGWTGTEFAYLGNSSFGEARDALSRLRNAS